MIQSERKILEGSEGERELAEMTLYLWASKTGECQIHSLQRNVHLSHIDKDILNIKVLLVNRSRTMFSTNLECLVYEQVY